jgi:pSer/pThr/pTyr-binding forkhead associated (FHA) protein
MKLSLMVLSEGKASGQAIPIKLSQFLIGRDPQCHLRPASPVISKRHCALITKNGKVFIRDFNSTNGSFVNEDKVEGQRELKDGDVVKLGPITFRVQIEGAVTVDKPTPLPVNRGDDNGNEEDAAAMLLLPDDDAEVDPDAQTAEAEIPSGTTMMDIPSFGMEAEAKAEAEKKAEKEKEGADRDAKAKEAPANSANAAAAILAKYSRRQRS